MGHIITNKHGLQLHSGGRKRPVETPASHPHLFKSARKYLKALPTAPDYNYFTKATPAVNDILGNDQLGDCTAAGACHLVEVFTANAGSPVVLQRQDAVGFYSLSTGYNPSDPSTDQGGDEVTVCSAWRDKGIDGKGTHAIKDWLNIDPSDVQLVRATGWLFEGHYLGVELDDSFPQISGSGFVWDTGTPDPNEGHCVVGAGANSSGILIDTWGFIGTFTYAGLAQFCSAQNGGNLFVIVTEEIINRASKKAPSAFDWAQLLADVQSAGGLASS